MTCPKFCNKCTVNINKVLPEFIYVPTAVKSHKSLSNLEQISQLRTTVKDETFRLKQNIAEIDEKLSSLATETQAELDKLISNRKLTVFYM